MAGVFGRLTLSLALSAIAFWPGLARAEWMEASSSHFVVYTDDSEKNLRRFSEQLERYHAAMAFITGRDLPAPSPSNRVTVYVVRSEDAVRKLYGSGSANIGGFYVPRAGQSIAIVPKVTATTGESNFSMVVLLHEYAHHFMISANAWGMPRWYSEGGAEFFASCSFESDGGVNIGRAAQHRAGELFYGRDVKVADLLDPTAYDQRKDHSYDAFYGKSWLLFHYLAFDKARSGQVAKYLQALSAGKDRRTAALDAFGDFDTLEKDVDRYLAGRKMMMFTLKPEWLTIGKIDLRRLTPGEAAMMPVMIRSRRGVDEDAAKAVLLDARKVAASYPQDAAVLSALAEAEHDAGNDDAAIAAADAALTIDPSQTNAYIQKGYALFRLAEKADAKDSEAAYRRARAPFVALNRRENDNPIPLIYFFRSYVEQGHEPPVLAVNGLIRAVEVAPFDLGLRMNLGTTLIRVGRQAEAKIVLGPVANSPHRDSMSQSAARLIARIDAEPNWKGGDMGLMLSNAMGTEGGE